jgi:hypothetical protein
MQPSGYSATPLARKLGIKNGFTIRLINAPDYYFQLFTDLPENLTQLTGPETGKNFIHYFATRAGELQAMLPRLRNEIADDGIIWVSWYKKSAKKPTDVTEHLVRETALATGLVDIKICAVDEWWSALKLVIPVKQRSSSLAGGH